MKHLLRTRSALIQQLNLILLAGGAAAAVACVGDFGDEPGPGETMSEGNPLVASGGTLLAGATGGSESGSGGTGGEGLTSSGSAESSGNGGIAGDGSGGTILVDCTPIASAGYELCETTPDSCALVFTDSSGCTAACAAAGLECEAAYENIDGACATDGSITALPCDTGHQSDYCLCRGSGGITATGGSSSAGGADGAGGTLGTGSSSGGDTSDCNLLTGQPIITVAKGGGANFATVQAAINSLSGSNSTHTTIKIAPGVYFEKLVVNVPNITLCGQMGQAANTRLTYSDGADTNGLGTSGSASVRISANDVSVENMTFENTRGVGSQAVALLVQASRVQFKGSRFIGNQDTLYVRGGPLYFRDCYVEGTVDYIFGEATAVFDECVIHNVGGGSAVTAPSTDQATSFGIVFLGGSLTAASGVSNGSVNLGRNWRPYGSTTFIGTELGSHIAAVGWIRMGENTLGTARFSEFQSVGPGANPGARASESKQLSVGEAAAFNIENMLSPWTPSFSE